MSIEPTRRQLERIEERRASGLFPIKSAPLRRSYARRDVCPECGGELDTGWECNDCNYDARDEAYPPDVREAEASGSGK
jgi:hypothetical protein